VATVLASTNAPGIFARAYDLESFNRFYPGDDAVGWLGCSMWSASDVDHVMLGEARTRRFGNCGARPWATAGFLELWNAHINVPYWSGADGLSI
jgi:hypothetical protein